MSKKEQLSYRGILCDSQEEIYFLMWAYELLDNGIIKLIERSKSFELSKPLKTTLIKKLKTKNKEVEKTILHGHIYTPEFTLWTDTLLRDPTKIPPHFCLIKIFEGHSLDCNPNIGIMGDIQEVFYIEVKPTYDQNNMTRLFKINQKWMWNKYQIFVNLVKPIELFEQTFVPKAYLKTPTGKDKKINFKYKLFEEWITELT